MPKPNKKKQESDEESFSNNEDFAGFPSDDEVDSDDFDEEFDDDENNGDDDDDNRSPVNEPVVDDKPKVSKHLLQLREKLGLDDLVAKKTAVKQTVETPKSNESKPGPVVVVYNDPSKRKKKKPDQRKRKMDEEESDYDEPMDLVKAKHDVKRFAMEQMKSKTKGKEEARVQLLVSLGAVAPKATPVNYKVYKQQRTKEQARAKRLKEADNIFARKIQIMARKKDNKKRDKNKVANFDADFGKVTKNSGKKRKNKGRK